MLASSDSTLSGKPCMTRQDNQINTDTVLLSKLSCKCFAFCDLYLCSAAVRWSNFDAFILRYTLRGCWNCLHILLISRRKRGVSLCIVLPYSTR